MLFHLSTNLHNLLNGRLATLLSSAFVTGGGPVWLTVPVLACLLALAELRFGTRRLVAIFFGGHIGATLLVAGGLMVAVDRGWISHAVMRVQDVGVSYGAMAVLGALTAVLTRRWRWAWAASWLAVAGLGVALDRTFTSVGHLLALAIGLVSATVMCTLAGRPGQWLDKRPFTHPDRALLAIAIGLGATCLLLA